MEDVSPLNDGSTVAEQLKQLAELETVVARLDQMQERLTAPAVDPGEIAFRDPRDVYHHITLGAVLAAHGFTAHDARTLDGLLSMRGRSFRNVGTALSVAYDTESFADVIRDELAAGSARYSEEGRYAEWRRRFDTYMTRTSAVLNALTEEQLEKMGTRPPSKGQMWLVRSTCACFRIDLPELTDRRAAFEWLRDVGANPRYREAWR